MTILKNFTFNYRYFKRPTVHSCIIIWKLRLVLTSSGC